MGLILVVLSQIFFQTFPELLPVEKKLVIYQKFMDLDYLECLAQNMKMKIKKKEKDRKKK